LYINDTEEKLIALIIYLRRATHIF